MKDWLEAFAQALIILVIMFFVFWPMKVDGTSMENTFYNGDRVAICRILGFGGNYDYGDIIVLKTMHEGEKKSIIKRVIALEGDEIQIKNSQVYVNGLLVEEKYIKGVTEPDLVLEIPKGSLFVMGDNRQRSYDSRSIGAIDKKDISGKVIMRFFPFDAISLY